MQSGMKISFIMRRKTNQLNWSGTDIMVELTDKAKTYSVQKVRWRRREDINKTNYTWWKLQCVRRKIYCTGIYTRWDIAEGWMNLRMAKEVTKWNAQRKGLQRVKHQWAAGQLSEAYTHVSGASGGHGAGTETSIRGAHGQILSPVG